MQKQHPTAGDFIEISLKQLIAVRYAAMLRDKANWEVVEEAIDHWLRKQEPSAVGEPEFAGYQWKNLFLPHGTVLRTAYNGKNVHCHVENDRITYEGKAVSPSGFVSAVGGIRRNAWKSIWLLLPDAKHWQLADHMRVRRSAPKARTRMHEARPCATPDTRSARGEPAPLPPSPVRTPPPEKLGEPRPPRAQPARSAFSGWARKPRPRARFAGATRALVALLRDQLRQDGFRQSSSPGQGTRADLLRCDQSGVGSIAHRRLMQ